MPNNRVNVMGVCLLLLVTSPSFSEEPEFFRGINVNGHSIEIDGNRWQGDQSEYFDCDNKGVTVADLDWKPEPHKNMKTMLRTFRWNSNARLRVTDVPDGTYSVWTYLLEDTESQQYDVFVEGLPAVSDYVSGPAGTWNKVGPWIVEISDGTITRFERARTIDSCYS